MQAFSDLDVCFMSSYVCILLWNFSERLKDRDHALMMEGLPQKLNNCQITVAGVKMPLNLDQTISEVGELL